MEIIVSTEGPKLTNSQYRHNQKCNTKFGMKQFNKGQIASNAWNLNFEIFFYGGNLILIDLLDIKFLCFNFPPTQHKRFFTD